MRLLLFVLAIVSPAAAQSGQYTVTNLGTFPGKPSSFATAINDSQVVVGISADYPFTAPFLGFRLENGVFQNLDSIGGGGRFTQAYGINNAGAIVGESQTADGVVRAFIKEPGFPMRALSALGGTGLGAAYSISSNGRVAGVSEIMTTYPATNPQTGEVYLAGRRATLWNPNGVNSSTPGINLGTLGDGDFSIAFGVNSDGVVLGQSMTASGSRAFIWDAVNGLRQVPAPPGALETFGRVISDTGIAAGYVSFPSGKEVFRWTASTGTQVLGKCANAQDAFARAINNAGQIAGVCRYSYGDRAAALINGVMTDLNTVVNASGAQWTLLDAWGIDSAGRIVGQGIYNGEMRPFMLTSDNVTATVTLTNSTGAGVAGGVVSYLDQSNVWQPAGTTGPSGSVQVSLPAGTWRFRMIYQGLSTEKLQNISTPVVFSTTAVKLQFSDSVEFLDHTGVWRAYTKPSMELLQAGSTLFRFGQGGTTPIVITGTEVRKSIAAERLIDSTNQPLTGGSGQYYLAGWRPCTGTTDANGYVLCVLDGFVAATTFGLEYAFTQQQKTQNIATDSYVLFQTRQVRLQLRNSSGASLDTGTAQYYAGGWRSFGTTSGGEVAKELMPGTYSFSMNYAFSQEQKSQDVAINPIVLFQTRAVSVQLRNSTGTLMDTGSAQYYAGGWRTIGNTSGGTVSVELMAGTYSFNMTYAFTTEQKTQNIASDPVVLFQTRAVVLSLKNSAGAPLDTGSAQYYAGGWRNIGNTAGGQISTELMAGTYSFNMTYAFTTEQKTQNIAADAAVMFQTRAVVLRLINSNGAPIDTGSAQYYSSGWRTVGNTSSGEASVELMAGTYSFSMTYAFTQQQKTQNIATDRFVIFQTGRVQSATNTCTGYYAGGWRAFVNSMDLLPGTYTFQFNDGTPAANASVTAATTVAIH